MAANFNCTIIIITTEDLAGGNGLLSAKRILIGKIQSPGFPVIPYPTDTRFDKIPGIKGVSVSSGTGF